MLIEFYGNECPHCKIMFPLIEQLEKEEGIKIEKYEVWHNEENLKKMQEYNNELCGGVPFFFNTDTKKIICGETTYENLKMWAKGASLEENHSPLKNIDYNLISDGIYIGTNQCCLLHFDEQLKNLGIEANISMEEDHADASFGVKFYLWLPVKNNSAPEQAQFDVGITFLEKLVFLKKKVYVHCKNGHGRAPTLVAAYFIKNGNTVDEAIELIRKNRPAIHLEDVQKEALFEFAKRINGLK